MYFLLNLRQSDVYMLSGLTGHRLDFIRPRNSKKDAHFVWNIEKDIWLEEKKEGR